MANKSFAIPRIDDATALILFHDIFAKHKSDGFNVDIAGLEVINLREPPEGDRKRILERVALPGTYLIASINIGYPQFNVTYARGANPEHKNIYVDTISVNGTQAGGLSQNARLEILEAINHFLLRSGFPTADNIDEVNELSALETSYRSTILKLEAKFAEQIEKITSWTVEQTTAFESRKLELASETQAERDALHTEHQAKLDKLQQDRDEFDQLKKKLDDRDYMHARRAIRGDMQQTIKDRQQTFRLTTDTRGLRSPMHAVMILLIGFLLVLNSVFLHQTWNVDVQSATWSTLGPLLVKQGVATAVLIGAVLYYLRWMNRWFEQHASHEFWLKQFELDFDRASWVVESALEWRRDQKTEIPNALLEGITRNLFSERENLPDKSTAADDLASALVGNASMVKLKAGDSEISIDRKGLGGLAKTETASHERGGH
ncbi:hypothetical protein JQ625_24970 [Bradyrhizobium diazoefficiens]|nr:hypothetical protein [Bradyrhizobium diazoefficiens]MBR0778096.1 hypothetical protein [Bradyrhizobium diazoefficiens]